jgi:hypothetical protein
LLCEFDNLYFEKHEGTGIGNWTLDIEQMVQFL